MEWIEKVRLQLYPRIQKSISQINRVQAVLVLLVLLGSSGGIVSGFVLARATTMPAEPMAWVEDISFHIPVVHIAGYTDTELVMKTDKVGVRIAMGEQVMDAPPDATFRVPLDTSLKAASASGSTATAQKSCDFVAGTSGKYVYASTDSRAQRLKTKRCFGSVDEATAAGLLVPEK